jgi:hypothetical protein
MNVRVYYSFYGKKEDCEKYVHEDVWSEIKYYKY